MAKIIYAAGLRLHECLQLRVQDLDFQGQIITVRSGKGEKDRTSLFPPVLHDEMRRHLRQVRFLYDEDRREKLPGVPLPYALERKYPSDNSHVQTTMIYTHVATRNKAGVVSPIERLQGTDGS
jgi:site-specific recombinase XerD